MSVYNDEQFVAKAVQSILDQTYQDFEFIIVDDGSSDRTSAILHDIRDSRIIHLHNPENIGLARSLNRGLEIAQGEYIARMDADDIALAPRLQKQLEYLDQHAEIGVLGTYMKVINATDQEIDKFEVSVDSDMMAWGLLFGSLLAHPTVMMRKTLLDQVAGYRFEFPHSQDIDLWIRLVRLTRFSNLPESLLLYRLTPDSVSQRHKDEQQQDMLHLRQQWVAQLLGRSVSIEEMKMLSASQLPQYYLHDGLSEDRINHIITLVLDIYRAMVEAGIIQDNPASETHYDLVRRIMLISRFSPRCVVPVELARHWKVPQLRLALRVTRTIFRWLKLWPSGWM